LTGTVSDELLKAIRRRDTKIAYRPGRIQQQQLSQRDALNPAKSPRSLPAKHFLGFLAAKPFDHVLIVTLGGIIVKRY
jgi:hypothetical protein